MTKLLWPCLGFVKRASPRLGNGKKASNCLDFGCLGLALQLATSLAVFCTPVTSAPVERVFSHGGIIMRSHRARLSDKTLCDIMLSRCNARFLEGLELISTLCSG